MYSAFDAVGSMTAGPDGLRGSASKHCGALFGAMTVRSVAIQVLTIVPSLPLAPCFVPVGVGEARYAAGASR